KGIGEVSVIAVLVTNEFRLYAVFRIQHTRQHYGLLVTLTQNGFCQPLSNRTVRDFSQLTSNEEGVDCHTIFVRSPRNLPKPNPALISRYGEARERAHPLATRGGLVVAFKVVDVRTKRCCAELGFVTLSDANIAKRRRDRLHPVLERGFMASNGSLSHVEF